MNCHLSSPGNRTGVWTVASPTNLTCVSSCWRWPIWSTRCPRLYGALGRSQSHRTNPQRARGHPEPRHSKCRSGIPSSPLLAYAAFRLRFTGSFTLGRGERQSRRGSRHVSLSLEQRSGATVRSGNQAEQPPFKAHRPSTKPAKSKPVKKPVPPSSALLAWYSRRLLALPMGRCIHISANRSALQDRADSTASLVSGGGCARRNQRRQQCQESCKSSYSHRRIVLAEFPNFSDHHRSVLRKRATAKDGNRPVDCNNGRHVCGFASRETPLHAFESLERSFGNTAID